MHTTQVPQVPQVPIQLLFIHMLCQRGCATKGALEGLGFFHFSISLASTRYQTRSVETRIGYVRNREGPEAAGRAEAVPWKRAEYSHPFTDGTP